MLLWPLVFVSCGVIICSDQGREFQERFTKMECLLRKELCDGTSSGSRAALLLPVVSAARHHERAHKSRTAVRRILMNLRAIEPSADELVVLLRQCTDEELANMIDCCIYF